MWFSWTALIIGSYATASGCAAELQEPYSIMQLQLIQLEARSLQRSTSNETASAGSSLVNEALDMDHEALAAKLDNKFITASAIDAISVALWENSHQVGTASKMVAWVIGLVSAVIIVLLVLLVLSDAGKAPFEVQGGMAPYRLRADAPRGQRPAPRAQKSEFKSGLLLPDPPVTAGARRDVPPITYIRDGAERPVPPPRGQQASAPPEVTRSDIHTLSGVTRIEKACQNCRNIFMDDAPFCRICGTRRPGHEASSSLLAGQESHLPDFGSPHDEGPDPLSVGSPRGSERFFALQNGASQKTPELCPWLVLSAESCFVVPVEKLMEGVGSFPLFGLSGQRLLRATVKTNGFGRTIEVSMPPQRSPMLASIGVAQGSDAPPGALEVRGGGRSGDERPGEFHYGWLRPSAGGGGGYLLTCNGVDVLSVACEGEEYKLYAQGSLVGGLGQVIAQASKCREPTFEGEEHLQVTVFPQTDAVLVICCVLAVILFGGGQELPAPGQSPVVTTLR